MQISRDVLLVSAAVGDYGSADFCWLTLNLGTFITTDTRVATNAFHRCVAAKTRFSGVFKDAKHAISFHIK